MLQNQTEKDSTITKVALYCRVSTTEQGLEGHSLEAQEAVMYKHCIERGYTVQEVYVDAGISGKEMTKRHALQRLLHDAEEQQFDLVLVWKLSRMGRNLKDVLEIVERLGKQQIGFLSLSEQFDTSTPSGRFMFQQMASFNEYERNIIAENVKLTMTKLAQDGHWTGNQVLGYDNARSEDGKGTLTINETEAAIIRLIFQQALEGKGYRSIANHMNQQGYRTKKGNTFSAVAIKDILRNPVYQGKIRYNRYENWANARRKGLSDEVILVQGQHPAIISEADWKQVGTLLDLQSKQPTWHRQGSNVLTGLLRCPQCDAPMAASNVTNTLKDGTKKRIRYYSCSQFRNKGASVCSANSIRADVAEKRVRERFAAYISQPRLLQQLSERLESQHSIYLENWQRQEEQLEAKQADLERQYEQITTILIETPELADDLSPRLRQIRQEQASLRAQLQQLDAKRKQHHTKPSLTSLEALFDLLHGVMKNQEKQALKAIYQLFIARIDWNKAENTLHVELNIDQATFQHLFVQEEEEVRSIPERASSLRLLEKALPISVRI